MADDGPSGLLTSRAGGRANIVANGTRRIHTDDGEIHVRIRGRGPRVLLLHGLTAHGDSWSELVRRLEESRTLVIPDLLSRGGSRARPELPHDLDRELARVRTVARETGTLGRPAVGHSQGAGLALAMAAGPDPPAALGLVCPVTPWTPRPPWLDLLRPAAVRRVLAPLVVRLRRPVCRWVLEHRVFGDPARVEERTVERYAAPCRDPTRARALLRVLADWRPAELADRLPSACPPAVVLAGGRDRRVPPPQARRLASALGAGFVRVPGAGHMVPVEAPDVTARALESVLDANRPPEG